MGVGSQELPFGGSSEVLCTPSNFHCGLLYRIKKGLYKRLAGKPGRCKERGVLMPTRITGRKLDGRGHPIDATGFAYDSDGPLAKLLAQRNSPLFSEPVTG